MRRKAEYRTPSYTDPKDRRLVQIFRRARRSGRGSVNLLGLPFDGAVLGRRGAAGGPAAIRQAMSFFSNYNPELGADLSRARVLDLGDLVLPPEDVGRAHSLIEREVAHCIVEDSLLVLLGGDNSISLPSLRAFGKRFGKVGLVVVDSHFDLRGEIGGRPTSGSSYGLALKTVAGMSPARVAEIGIHGFLNSRVYASEAEAMGVQVYTAADVREKGATAIARSAFATASEGSRAVYLSVDLDAVDVAYVSGVSAPSAGGISAGELFDIAYCLAGREKVRCADLVELAPHLDPSGRSQVTAATALSYIIAGFTSRRASG